MHHKSKQRRQKSWDDGVAPGVYMYVQNGAISYAIIMIIDFVSEWEVI